MNKKKILIACALMYASILIIDFWLGLVILVSVVATFCAFRMYVHNKAGNKKHFITYMILTVNMFIVAIAIFLGSIPGNNQATPTDNTNNNKVEVAKLGDDKEEALRLFNLAKKYSEEKEYKLASAKLYQAIELDPDLSKAMELKEQVDIEKSMITRNGGLGDSLDVFELKYGPEHQDELFSSFNDDEIVTRTVDNRVFNLTLAFEQSYIRTENESMNEILKVIPTDAVKIKQYILEDDFYKRKIMVYKSNKLAEVIPKGLFIGSSPGVFTVTLKSDDRGVFAAVLGTGENP